MNNPVKKKGQKYPNHPEDNRLVKCYCFNWSPYEVIGAFIPYKNLKNTCIILLFQDFVLKIIYSVLKVAKKLG